MWDRQRVKYLSDVSASRSSGERMHESEDLPWEDHKTSDPEMYGASLKRSESYKAWPYQYASTSKQILKAKAKPFPPCTHCSFSDHKPDDYRNYPECEICGSFDHSTSRHNRVIHIIGGVLDESSQFNESSIRGHLGKFDAKADDGYFLGYSFISKDFKVYNTRRQHIEETYHVTFNESMAAIRFTNILVDEIGIDDSSRYPPNEFLHEDDPFIQYQDDQRITQPTDVPSGDNNEASRPITEPLVLDVPQSYILNQASISSHPTPQDRWSRDQHIKLANIIGSKWVFRNKKDEHGITTKNKARLAAQGYSKEVGIDYDETFAPVTRMEVIRIFFAFATYMNFKVYQIDVKSAFLNGKLKEEVYVKQPLALKVTQTMLVAIWKVGKLVFWSAKKQQSVAVSLAEAEYIIADSAISISNNLVLHSRTKQIEIRYYFISDHILKGDIKLHFIPTEYQLADIFTKLLDEPTFTRLKTELGMSNVD
nr:hypothetical protein [Tanacetum cinerariifolium]